MEPGTSARWAVIVTEYFPGLSVCRCESRPANFTEFLPDLPASLIVPRVTVSAHDGFLRFLAVCVTHLPATLRPWPAWVNLRVTVAVSLSVNENLVPTGGRCLAALPVTRHRNADSLNFDTAGRGADERAAGAGTVTATLVAELAPYAELAVTVQETGCPWSAATTLYAEPLAIAAVPRRH